MHRYYLAFLVAVAIVISFMPAPLADAQDDNKALESSLAKAYIYMASRTTWQELSSSNFVFCITRDHSLFEWFSKILPTIKLYDRPVELRQYDIEDIVGLRQCNLIALTNIEKNSRAVIAQIKGYPVLTISHEIDITQFGGLVYLVYDKKLEPPKIDFDTLGNSKLNIDAGILDLSRKRWGSGN